MPEVNQLKNSHRVCELNYKLIWINNFASRTLVTQWIWHFMRRVLWTTINRVYNDQNVRVYSHYWCESCFNSHLWCELSFNLQFFIGKGCRLDILCLMVNPRFSSGQGHHQIFTLAMGIQSIHFNDVNLVSIIGRMWINVQFT